MRAFAIVTLWLAAAGPAFAVLLPPSSAGALQRGVVVLDESDRVHDLRSLAAGTPSLMVPIFTRCGGTCPLTALVLKDALRRTRVGFAVVLLSFDPEDGASDLKRFRTRFALPAEWSLVRSADPAPIRGFLDGLGFRVRKASGGFDHPNQTFVFSAEGTWTGTFAGSGFGDDELWTAWRRALSTSHPTPSERLAVWLVRPEAWIAIACVGLCLALFAIGFVARRSRTTSPDP